MTPNHALEGRAEQRHLALPATYRRAPQLGHVRAQMATFFGAESAFHDKSPAVSLFSADSTTRKLVTFVGSGTLVLFERRGLLLTAAHVVAQLSKKPLFMRTAAQAFQVPTVGDADIAVDYKLDLAAISLDPTFVAEISPYAAIFKLYGYPNDGQLLATRVIGHPASRNRQKRLGEPAMDHAVAILGTATTKTPRRFKPANGAEYLFIEMDPEKYLNDEGARFTPPQFSGMSGGPVLGFYNNEHDPWIEFEGIFIEWHKADRIGVALRRTTLYSALHAWEFGNTGDTNGP